MKIIVFGDIHGRDVWKKVLDERIDNVDKVIFLGDYFTSREGINEYKQNLNFLEILKYKENYPDKITLLRGNHDMEALKYEWADCHPCYYGWWVNDNAEMFLSNTQWLVQIDNMVFSHAGITQRWWTDMQKLYPQLQKFEDVNQIEPSYMFGFRSFKFSDYHGDTPTQPLTWVRPACLCENGYPDITYVVGHTTQDSIINYKDNMLNLYGDDMIEYANCNVWVCDTLPREYLLIDDGEFIPVKIEM